MQYNSVYDVVVSGDQSGMLEYWAGPAQDYGFPKVVKFEYKTDTDLYEFAKVSTSSCIHTFFASKRGHQKFHRGTGIFSHFLKMTAVCFFIPPQAKTKPLSLTFSPTGKLFVVMGGDRKVRVFHFLTGRLYRVFDEAISIFTEQQQVDSLGSQ